MQACSSCVRLWHKEDEEEAEQNAKLRGSFQALMLRRRCQHSASTFSEMVGVCNCWQVLVLQSPCSFAEGAAATG